jgi:release factor glutamine methyltransferase
MEIYEPKEDSYLLEKQVKTYIASLKDKNIKVLDMGSGSGIQAKAAIKEGIKRINVLALDINPDAVKHLKKEKIPAKKSDLFSAVKDRTFDLIIFNAPYLPEDPYDKQPDTTAGKKGWEIIIKFLRKAKKHLNKDGIILLLFSSLSNPEKILSYTKEKGYKSTKLAEQGVGLMEKLFVYRIEQIK